MDISQLTCLPVTIDSWPDMQALFGPHGAVGGCWCMWWRLKRSEFEKQHGEGNRQAMQTIIESGETPGLLAYNPEGQPIGWVSIAPRDAFPVFGRSPVLKPVDDQPVWSLVCFFIANPYRNQGMTSYLINAALEYARHHGARIVEAYPIEPKSDSAPDIYAFTGLAPVFRKLGFVEVARRSPTRPIMRYFL